MWAPIPGTSIQAIIMAALTSETITVTVTAQPVLEYIPPVPVNLASTQDNFWIQSYLAAREQEIIQTATTSA